MSIAFRARRRARARSRHSRLTLLLAAAALAAGCSDALPEVGWVASAQAPDASALHAEIAPGAAALPPVGGDFAGPAALLRAAASAAAREGETGASSEAAARAESQVSLEALLRAPRTTGPPSDPPLDLRAHLGEPQAPESAGAPGPFDAWKDRVRLKRRSEEVGPPGPRQDTLTETEAALRVPLDDSVSLEGGLRVDQRDRQGAEQPERQSIPRVGVEVKF